MRIQDFSLLLFYDLELVFLLSKLYVAQKVILRTHFFVASLFCLPRVFFIHGFQSLLKDDLIKFLPMINVYLSPTF